MSTSEPGGDLREALESIWEDWKESDPEGVMSFNDFLSPEIEATLRLTFRHYIRRYLRPDSDEGVDGLVDEWVQSFAISLRDKRPEWRDWSP